MRKRHSAVPHRLGRRTNFIPSPEGKPAKWAQVVDIAGDAAERATVAAAATATLLTIDADGMHGVATADVSSLRSMVPDWLLPVRRPASHKGKTNYISRVVVPTEAHEARAVWCESFNELTHLRDLLITRQPTQVATRPLRLEWAMTTGVRGHVPDFLIRDVDGRMLLVDVTTVSKLDDPRLRAVLQLTAATADILDWEYQVRRRPPPRCRGRRGQRDLRDARTPAADHSRGDQQPGRRRARGDNERPRPVQHSTRWLHPQRTRPRVRERPQPDGRRRDAPRAHPVLLATPWGPCPR